MSRGGLLLWVVLPYVSIAVFVVGHVWRYRRDQLTWTTRSTQILERRLLRSGSILFHVGALLAIAGHALGMLVPEAWTEALGIPEGTYHAVSVTGGTLAGLVVAAGFLILLYRRLTVSRVAATTSTADVLTYLLLTLAIGTGLVATGHNLFTGGYDYRETVAPWFRALFVLDPQPERMEGIPFIYQFHVTSVWFLYMLWPFSRLVHVWSVPVTYLRRAHIIFRSRTGGPPPRRPSPAPAQMAAPVMQRRTPVGVD